MLWGVPQLLCWKRLSSHTENKQGSGNGNMTSKFIAELRVDIVYWIGYAKRTTNHSLHMGPFH